MSRRLSLGEMRDVEGPLAADFEPLRADARALARARSRLARGDAPGAEEIYDSLWSHVAATPGPTRAEVAAGLLACRVQRGAWTSAVDAWLAGLEEWGSRGPGSANPAWPSAIGTWGDLVRELPPAFVDSAATRAWADRELAETGDGRASDYQMIYRQAARLAAGRSWTLPAGIEKRTGPWRELPGEMVLAMAPDESVRAASRERIQARLDNPEPDPAWVQAWARFGLGRSLLVETDVQSRRLGLLQMMWVLARPEIAPTLATPALTLSVEALRDMGHHAEAERLLASFRSPAGSTTRAAPDHSQRRDDAGVSKDEPR